MRYAWIASLVAAVMAISVQAAPNQVQVVGLFEGAAVLLVDGQRKFVRAGQTGPGGVKVVSANSQGAVLNVAGVERRFNLSREHATQGFAAPTKKTHSIARGPGGHYWVDGSVKGFNVRFLVDTGATSVAMNEMQANRLNIDFKQGVPTHINTASGVTQGWQVKLPQVSIGGIEVLGVEAVVLEGGFPTEVLLGMSYLNHVSWREEQGLLVLESRL